MQYTKEQLADYKGLYKRKKRNQILLAIPMIGVLLILILSEGKQEVVGVPMTIAGPFSLAVVIGCLVFSFFNWRCPACGKYLGRTLSHKYCSKCGIELS